MRRLTVTASLAIAASIAAASPASASRSASGAPQNIVQAETTAAHPVAERSHVQVATFSGTTNDATNAAVAYAHDCTGCRTVVVAFQAELVWGQQDTAVPENDAIAVNDHCTGCYTFAYAYQDVIRTAGPSRLSDRAEEQVEDISDQIRALTHAQLSYDELNSRLEALRGQFKQAVESGIVGADERGEHGHTDTAHRG